MGSAQQPGSTIRRQPFIEHVHELRIRLTWTVTFLFAAAGATYVIHEQLLSIIQQPLNQTLYYTSPIGGLSFVLKLCLTAGLIASLPIILYHVVSFVRPLISKVKTSTLITYSVWSFLLAIGGVLFAYFISLPAALHFLASFGGDSVQSLITANEYFNFALAYMTGFAVLFQIPLIVLIINRIKPLKPSQMMRAQPHIVLVSFIAAAILTPTPDPINQALMAAPMIVMYQVGVVIVYAVNYRTYRREKKAKRRMRVAASAPTAQVRQPTLQQVQKKSVAIPTTASLPVLPTTRVKQFDFVTTPSPKHKPKRIHTITIPNRKFMDVIPPSRA